METKKQETKYNKIVNFDEDTKEIIVLDGIFKYEDGFKGATGSKFEPVSRDEYEDRTDEDNFVFDTSYNELWEYLREELNLSEDEAYIFNCIGGGRCFGKDFNGNINPELSILIREIES